MAAMATEAVAHSVRFITSVEAGSAPQTIHPSFAATEEVPETIPG